MVPIYAFASWLSLGFPTYSLYIDLVRDCYEAFVIYSFVSLLIHYSDGEDKLVKNILAHHPPMHHMAPLNFIWRHHFPADRQFFINCKRVVLQYVFVKPLTAALAIILDENDLYGEGIFRVDRGYMYLMVINNISVTMAMYGLLYFYHAVADELKKIGPLAKLLCIKAVLFLSFWQGIVIAMLAHYGLVHGSVYNTLDQVETELQDFLLCFEMLFAAMAHGYAYNHMEFRSSKAGGVGKALKDALSVHDVAHDVQKTFGDSHTKNN